MNRKTVWLVFASLLTLALVPTACDGTSTTTPAPRTSASTAPPPSIAPASTPLPDRPQYGGTITRMLGSDSGVFDPATQGQLIGPACAAFVMRSGSLSTGRRDSSAPARPTG